MERGTLEKDDLFSYNSLRKKLFSDKYFNKMVKYI